MKGLCDHAISRRSAITVLTSVATLMGMSGCSFFVPSRDEVQPQTVSQAIDDSLLITPATLTVALNMNDAPQSMDNGNGPEGYAVDVARSLAEHLGLSVAFVTGTSAADSLTKAEADMFLGVTAVNANSSNISIFGDYLEDATALFGAINTSQTSLTLDDLSSSVVGVQESSASQEAATRAGLMATQQTFSNVNECFDALEAGTVDYVVCDATSGAYLSRVYEGVAFIGTLSAVTPYGAAVLSTATDLQEVLSNALSELSDDGILEAIHAYWYGTLPFSLSDQTVTGATVATNSASSSAETGDTASDATSDDSDSLNSLS